jgi:hypothetical protein
MTQSNLRILGKKILLFKVYSNLWFILWGIGLIVTLIISIAFIAKGKPWVGCFWSFYGLLLSTSFSSASDMISEGFMKSIEEFIERNKEGDR